MKNLSWRVIALVVVWECLLALLGHLLTWPAAAQVYTITDLGALPGRTDSSAVAINNSGQVVGRSWESNPVSVWDTPTSTMRAFLWQNGVITDLTPTLPENTSPGGINNKGQVVINSQYPTCPGGHCTYKKIFLWQNGQLIDLGQNFPSSECGCYPSGLAASGINDSGQLIFTGHYIGGGYYSTEAFIWQNGQATSFGYLGDPYWYPIRTTIASSINNIGQVVGESWGGWGTGGPFLWQNGVMTKINQLPSRGGKFGISNINDQGQMVGWLRLGGSGSVARAFLRNNGVIKDLGTLPGDTSSSASKINNLGQVIGASSRLGSRSRPFLYSNGVMVDLSSLILPNSGWVLESVSDINDAGQIVGTGTFLGRSRAFLLTPIINNIVPDHGGNGGEITVTIVYPGIKQGATVKLEPDIIGENMKVIDYIDTTAMITTFNLRGATPGVRNVIITQPDGTTITLSKSFIIEEGGAPQIWVNVMGRSVVRGGRQQTYYVIYGNRGSTDAAPATAVISFPLFISWNVESGHDPVRSIQTSENNILFFGLPMIPPEGVVMLPIRLTVPSDQQRFSIRAWTTSRSLALSSEEEGL